MDGRLAAEGLRKREFSDNPYDDMYGTLQIPWYGNTEPVGVVFENEEKGAEPTDAQIEAFCRLISHWDTVSEDLQEKLFAYFNTAKDESDLDDDVTARLFPQISTPLELRDLITTPTILVSYYDGSGWSDYIGLLAECKWEIEHGLGVKIVDNKVIEIGFQDIVI